MLPIIAIKAPYDYSREDREALRNDVIKQSPGYNVVVISSGQETASIEVFYPPVAESTLLPYQTIAGGTTEITYGKLHLTDNHAIG